MEHVVCCYCVELLEFYVKQVADYKCESNAILKLMAIIS